MEDLLDNGTVNVAVYAVKVLDLDREAAFSECRTQTYTSSLPASVFLAPTLISPSSFTYDCTTELPVYLSLDVDRLQNPVTEVLMAYAG